MDGGGLRESAFYQPDGWADETIPVGEERVFELPQSFFRSRRILPERYCTYHDSQLSQRFQVGAYGGSIDASLIANQRRRVFPSTKRVQNAVVYRRLTELLAHQHFRFGVEDA